MSAYVYNIYINTHIHTYISSLSHSSPGCYEFIRKSLFIPLTDGQESQKL